jgi:NOL1/NOP2/fmu family ribosome biogenesis protein
MVTLCSQRQQRILANVWKCLKPNGILIYSTCSFSETENETLLDWMMDELQAENIAIKIPEEWNIVSTKSKKHEAQGFRFYPHLLKGEGFFCGVMRKSGTENFKQKKSQKAKKNNQQIDKKILSNWLKDIDKLEFHQKNEFVIAQPKNLADDFEWIAANLNVIKSGINLGQLTHKDLIPDHELAMSNLLSEKIKTVELSHEQAIQYLKKEEIKDFETGSIGWVMMQHQHQNLGWAKVLPNRINNYYPMNARIFNRKSKKK